MCSRGARSPLLHGIEHVLGCEKTVTVTVTLLLCVECLASR